MFETAKELPVPGKSSLRGRRQAIVDLATHPEPFVTVAALAAYWCVSPDTVYRDIAKGALPAYRVGSSHSIRIRVEDARAYGRPDEG
jgi:excisionase family DNA binding protein